MKSILALFFLSIFPLFAEPVSDNVKEVEASASAKKTKNYNVKSPPKRNGKFIDYEAEFDGRTFSGVGYLVLPEGASAANPVPGVIVVHEWWGQTAYPRKRAEMLAELGYAAFAIDMYGGGVTVDKVHEAGSLMVKVIQDYRIVEERFSIGMQVLQEQPEVDGSKIASIGYSVGGTMAMQAAACNIPNLLGVVAFHSGPDIEIPKGMKSIDAKILICNGEDDTLIMPDTLSDFYEDIRPLKTDITFETYPGVINGFTNPESDAIAKKFNSSVAYNKEADEKSWNSMQAFLKLVFK
ncbi:dienelactone hydrolase family protein [Puniceicoccaceae bacterium K14]|nr:dienelactone hydrolase family protein [Puniceicoccaceae bacterium K14]